MPDSRIYPDLERKPGGPDNWVEAAGGLPSYIERIAKRLHYEKGMSISHAIATAVNTVKRWARMGKVAKHGDPNNKHVSPETVVQAQAALAEWEAKKKAGSLALSEGLLAFIDMCDVPDEFAIDLAQTCKMCDAPATKKVIWADGRAYQPSCDDHVKAVQDMLTKKNGEMTELSGVRDLSDADIDRTSTMVALMLPESVASKIVVEDGVPVEDMHITITFNGDVDDVKFKKLVDDLKSWAADMPVPPVLKGSIGGIGTFPADDPEKGRPWFVPVDIPGLNTLHEQIKAVCDDSAPAAENHGYTPHSTLTYGGDAPEPVERIPVEFNSFWVVRGNEERVEIPFGKETGAGGEQRDILTAPNFDVAKDAMNLAELAERAGRIADPHARAVARQKILDMASTIPPAKPSGKVKDGRRSYKRQGKWGHGFVPLDQKAKESKAKGSPIAMKRMNRLFGQRKSAAEGRAGDRSGRGIKRNPEQIHVDERNQPGSEKAKDIAHLNRTKFDDGAKVPDAGLPTRQKEASKSSRVPARATQNWDEIPDSLKTVRGGKRYVLAEFGGTQYVTEWIGGVNKSDSTALDKRKVYRTLTSADAANMSAQELRDILNNPRTSDAVRDVANKALRKIAKEAKK